MPADQDEFAEKLRESGDRLRDAVMPTGVVDSRVGYVFWTSIALVVCAFSKTDVLGYGPFSASISKRWVVVFLCLALIYWNVELRSAWKLAKDRTDAAIRNIAFTARRHISLMEEAQARHVLANQRSAELAAEYDKRMAEILHREDRISILEVFGPESEKLDKERRELDEKFEKESSEVAGEFGAASDIHKMRQSAALHDHFSQQLDLVMRQHLLRLRLQEICPVIFSVLCVLTAISALVF